jgi:septal ring factor EnvC (AmiA/AmiB activator)
MNEIFYLLMFGFAVLGLVQLAGWLYEWIQVLAKMKKLVNEQNQNDAELLKELKATSEVADRVRNLAQEINQELLQNSTPTPTPDDRLAAIRQQKAILEGTTETQMFEDPLDELRRLNEEELRIKENNHIFS